MIGYLINNRAPQQTAFLSAVVDQIFHCLHGDESSLRMVAAM